MEAAGLSETLVSPVSDCTESYPKDRDRNICFVLDGAMKQYVHGLYLLRNENQITQFLAVRS